MSQASGPAAAPAAPSGGFTGDTGPGFWADLDPANAACRVGISQSPINIKHVKNDKNLRPLKLALEATPISLINNGHAIEEEIESPNTLTLNGDVYTSAQFHFHTLSEHAIGGQRGVMELHAVFKNPAENRAQGWRGARKHAETGSTQRAGPTSNTTSSR